jgi:hypothetical protein
MSHGDSLQSDGRPSDDKPRVCLLDPGVHVKDVADACRSAALAFAWSASRGWNKRDLARWLAGPYATAVSATRSLRAGSALRVVRPTPIAEKSIADLVARTHSTVLTALRSTWAWMDDSLFARDMVDVGLVAGIMDETSAIGFAPIDGPRMRLAARVESLFVADYLTRPADYETFRVCNDCNGVTYYWLTHEHTCVGPTPKPGPVAAITTSQRAPRAPRPPRRLLRIAVSTA